MKIIEKNEGKKIDYSLTGTMLEFADGALTLNLARYQQDTTTTRDIMVDNDGYLTTGRGRYYAAQVEIPAAEYKETVVEREDAAEQGDTGEGGSMNRDTIIRERLPLDTEKVTLYLFSIEGIIIH